MADISLDALRAARLERRKDAGEKPPTVELGGQSYDLPYSLPLAAGHALISNDALAFAKALFGDQWEKALDAGLDRDDVLDLVPELSKLYGVGEGPESDASLSSSPPTSKSSRPKSKRSTA